MKKEQKPKKLSTPLKVAIGVVTLIFLYLISFYIPVVRSVTYYPVAYFKCGGNPVIGDPISQTYILAGDLLYDKPSFAKPSTFFCTSAEAEAAGFTHSPLR